MAVSHAQAHLRVLGIPATLDHYSREDAERVLQGRSVDPNVRDTVHNKLAWVTGAQLANHLSREFPALQWTPDLFAVRAIDHGESSASYMQFSDGSHLVLISRVFQETLIAMANIIGYFDVSTAVARLSLRPSKRDRLRFESAARVTGMLRYLVISQRLTGEAPPALADLDQRSAQTAGQLAAAAVTFVIAHEIGHIALRHEGAPEQDDDASIARELQADAFALNLVTQYMADDHEMVLWSAFIAMFARQITETAIYIRRSRAQPRAFARWGVLERNAGEQDARNENLRLAVGAATAGALTRDDSFPVEHWELLWKDPMLSVAPSVTPATLARWDRLQTGPLRSVTAAAEHAATQTGRALFADLRSGALPRALEWLEVDARAKAQILDLTAPLGFFTLRKAIEMAPASLTTGDMFEFSVAGARLAAEHLRGDHVDDW